jgi:hypothetical protein
MFKYSYFHFLFVTKFDWITFRMITILITSQNRKKKTLQILTHRDTQIVMHVECNMLTTTKNNI